MIDVKFFPDYELVESKLSFGKNNSEKKECARDHFVQSKAPILEKSTFLR